MKTATVRDLRYDFPKIEKMLRDGEEVLLTKRGKVFGKLSPVDDAPAERPALPDFAARRRRLFGDRMSPITGAELIRRDRDGGF